MPRKKRETLSKNGNAKETKAFGEWSFVKHNMTRDEKADFDNWDITPDAMALELDRLIDGDYKVSIAHDDYNNCVTASAACRSKANDDYGLILTARAPSALDALRVLIYKHTVLLAGGWLAFTEEGETGNVWG